MHIGIVSRIIHHASIVNWLWVATLNHICSIIKDWFISSLLVTWLVIVRVRIFKVNCSWCFRHLITFCIFKPLIDFWCIPSVLFIFYIFKRFRLIFGCISNYFIIYFINKLNLFSLLIWHSLKLFGITHLVMRVLLTWLLVFSLLERLWSLLILWWVVVICYWRVIYILGCYCILLIQSYINCLVVILVLRFVLSISFVFFKLLS